MASEDRDKKAKDKLPDLMMEVPPASKKPLPETSTLIAIDDEDDLTVGELVEYLKNYKKQPECAFESAPKKDLEPKLKIKLNKLIDSVSIGNINHGVISITAERGGVVMTTRSENKEVIEKKLQLQIDILEERGVETKNKKIIVKECTPKTREIIEKFCQDKGITCEFIDGKTAKATKGSKPDAPAATVKFGP